ncbi:hypothetical protein PX52LOC_07119 [Limnoglobus roseus]|uniref:Uncharacterized protein n=1 Tax=Limnoglobus roseus TaxID=2598579 RepID=A0A5C1APH2_9BACT|nr:hypothetical protein PX52LOC_07119 [Limnoglobus roseus]
MASLRLKKTSPVARPRQAVESIFRDPFPPVNEETHAVPCMNTTPSGGSVKFTEYG